MLGRGLAVEGGGVGGTEGRGFRGPGSPGGISGSDLLGVGGGGGRVLAPVMQSSYSSCTSSGLTVSS